MKIGIAALGRISEDTGGKNYILHFIRELESVPFSHTFVLFLSEGERAKLGIVESNILKIITIHSSQKTPLHKVFGEQVLLPSFIRREKIEVMYYPGNFVSLRSRVPSVVNIRSAAHFYGKKYGITGMRRVIRSLLMPLSVRKANAVITPSEDIKRDIVRFANILPSKVEVISHGVDLRLFDGEKNRVAIEGYELLEKYGLSAQSYILYASALWRYKRQNQLIRAHAKLVQDGFSDLKLVLAGMGTGTEKSYISELHALVNTMGTDNLVIFTGGLPQSDLRYLYAHARAFVFPSTYESFGNPIFESWSSGIPVAVSNVHSFPEIAENAAIFFDPNDAEDLRNTIARILLDPDLRDYLIQRGLDRAKKFTWDTTVRRTLSLIERVNETSRFTM